MDVPAYSKPLIVTDAAVNIQPTLEQKRQICQNAVDLVRKLGNSEPKVAVLAAVETVNPNMPATLDAAALTVMAARGQISGAKVDGPLAFDNAISPDAARTKGIVSPVAVMPTFCSSQILNWAICLRSSLSTLRVLPPRASCLAPAFR